MLERYMLPFMRHLLTFTAILFFSLNTYSQTGDEQVEQMLNDSLKRSPNNSNWLFLKGMLLAVEYKKYEEAIPYLTSSLKNLHQFKVENPSARTFPNDLPLDSCDILHIRAYCYDHIDSITNAIEDYRYLQQRQPNHFFYSVAVAKLYIKHKLFDKAQIELDIVKNQVGNNERGLVQQANYFYELSKYDDAEMAVEFALQRYPKSIEGLLIKGKVMIKLKREQEACKYFDEAKSKMNLDYFGGQSGYGFQQEVEKDINEFKSLYCK